MADRSSLRLVAVGASADGVEALIRFVTEVLEAVLPARQLLGLELACAAHPQEELGRHLVDGIEVARRHRVE